MRNILLYVRSLTYKFQFLFIDDGSSHLNWNRCCYPICGKTFQTAISFVNHLISCARLSFLHEIAVNETFFTPE